jgi:hypothetical protein
MRQGRTRGTHRVERKSKVPNLYFSVLVQVDYLDKSRFIPYTSSSQASFFGNVPYLRYDDLLFDIYIYRIQRIF